MQKVIAIIGPTASGKSALGIALAKKLRGEIVSADSRQIYRGMNIITRTPSKKEIAGIPHHLLGIANPKQQYSAGTYTKKAASVLKTIISRKRLPIVVGGTGFYADALLRGLSLPEVPQNKTLRAKLSKKTPKQLLAMLQQLDPKSAARVDPKNIVRLIRAIEIAKKIGPIPAIAHNPNYETLWLGLAPEAKKHARAIRAGVAERLQHGAVNEAAKLRALLGNKRFTSLGFEFSLLADYLDKKIAKTDLALGLAQRELAYSKRQMRWFKRNSDIHWVRNKTEALRLAKKFLSR